jgi:hypothetical protein
LDDCVIRERYAVHFSVLVAADNLVEALAPFRDGLSVPSYTRECYCRRRGDREFVDDAYPNCRICRGTGALETDFNPAGRWDSFVTKANDFQRRPGVPPLRRRDDYEGLCWAPSWIGDSPDHFPRRLAAYLNGRDWDQAYKGDLDLEAMLTSGWCTYAAIIDGTWHQSGYWFWFPSVARVTDRLVFAANDWPGHFNALVRSLSDGMLLTLVDCHG